MPALLINNEIYGNTPVLGHPDYSQRQLLVDYAADVANQTITMEEDGYIQLLCRTNGTSGTPFCRLIINTICVHENFAPTSNYSYSWTPAFYVRKGDTVMYTLTTGVTNGKMYSHVYFYPQVVPERLVSSEGIDITALRQDVDTIESNLTDSGWITSGSVKYRKKNGFVTVVASGLSMSQKIVFLATLPVGYRPSITIHATGVCGNYDTSVNLGAAVRTDGIVQYRTETTGSYTNGAFSVTYPVD